MVNESIPDDDPVVNSFYYIMEQRGYEVALDYYGGLYHVVVTHPQKQTEYRGDGGDLHKLLSEVAERVGLDILKE